MTDNARLSELLEKIRRTENINAIDIIEYIDKVESNYDFRANNNNFKYIDSHDIKEIIQEYKSYPLYLIKYIFTIYPKTSSREALDHIVKSRERRSDLMECILTAYSVKLCEIPDISFDCRLVRACQAISESKAQSRQRGRNRDPDLYGDDEDNSLLRGGNKREEDETTRELIDAIEDINTKPKHSAKCNCMDRRHWSYLYDYFMDLIDRDHRFMFESYNINYSITNLVAQTDVADSRLANILKKSIDIPERWRGLLIFIKKTGLVSSAYGDMIFSIRDAIIVNDRKERSKSDPRINKFNDRVLLSTLLKRYNQYHRNMSLIADNMYITDINGARNTDLLRDKNIDCVVSLTKRSIFKASNVRYFHIQIDDIESADFLSMTLDVADKVIELISQDQIILVHCYKGVSRSVSFVILVLVKQGMNYADALELVKKKRPSANPNPAFRKQLEDYSRRLNRN